MKKILGYFLFLWILKSPWMVRKLVPLLVLSLFLASCTGGNLPPKEQSLLLVGPEYEVILLSNWRTPKEKKETLSPPFFDDKTYQTLINGGTRLLSLSPNGNWEIKPLGGGTPQKGDFQGKVSLALNHARDKALVQVQEGGSLKYLIWDLKTNQMESWTPSLPQTFGEQKAVMGYMALEGDLIAIVTQGSTGTYHLWTISGSEAHHLFQLPDIVKPVSQLFRPSGGPMGRLLSISPDRNWCVLIASLPGMGTLYFIINCKQGQRYTEFWPEHIAPSIHNIFWSSDSLHLLVSSEMQDGSGFSFLFNLPPTKKEQLNDLAFWVSEDWLLLYHTAPPGEVAFPPVEATLRSISSGEEVKVDLSDYIGILDVLPGVLGKQSTP
ncbi:MAG: WD40 repeat domain-containing protein [Coprothermobacterota bacterium]|nr:WD40 repeat domain-containing protein [Coprothermobacterota bacterium]